MPPLKRYPVLAEPVRVEDVIERSRFITSLAPAESIAAAKAFIAVVSAEFSDATHNCWAYLVGPPGSMAQIGLSDAGEPHGTAGRPMLNVLQACSVGDLVAVVTRYFGGIKLGTGGLSRAYSGGVQQALAAATLTERIEWQLLRLRLEYPQLEACRRLWAGFEAEVLAEEFSDVVRLELRVPAEQAVGLRAALVDRTRGQVEIDEG